MKNSKKIVISIILCSLHFLHGAQALNEPTVEIYNKTTRDLGVTVINLDNGITSTLTIPAEQAQKYNTHIDSRLKFEMWSPSNPTQALGIFSINAPGKTKYLSWDPAKSTALYPQSGSLMSFGDKTKSGLSLKNNIKSSDDIKVEKGPLTQVPSKVAQPSPQIQSKQASVPSSRSSYNFEIMNKLNKDIFIGMSQKPKMLQKFIHQKDALHESVSTQDPVYLNIYDVKKDNQTGQESSTYSGSEYTFTANPIGKQTIYLEVVSSGSSVTLRPKSDVSPAEKQSNIESSNIKATGSSKVLNKEFFTGSFSFKI
ncbi:MAG TPA: hypothetical protein VKU36_05345 [Candidatus Babeliales bacterium]|nr:hypothetical protein [Candidatus Babeliales bacterium]